jgi:hypothetical protein
MKLNKKKISALLGVGLISALTFGPTLNTQAALAAPTDWDFKYTNEDIPGYKLRNTTGLISMPGYTRTADGAHYNYVSNFQVIPSLNVIHTFNRSNTSWYYNAADSLYVPSDSSIGASSGQGSVIKASIYIENYTINNYVLYLDFSSSTSAFWFGFNTGDEDLTIESYYYSGNYITFWLAAGMEVEIFTSETGDGRYFDAWYLEDRGVNDTYYAGYGAGYDVGFDDGFDDTPSLLVMGFSAMVGILVNFVLMIVNLEVFGVSILGIFSIVVLFTGIVWVLKLIRG